LERLLQISQQIAGVFYAARKANQAIAQAERGAAFGGNRRMRHPRGLADQRFHAAKRLGERENADALENVRRALARSQFDADHAPETGHLSPSERVLWMARQADVVDVFRPHLIDQPARHFAAVEVVLT